MSGTRLWGFPKNAGTLYRGYRGYKGLISGYIGSWEACTVVSMFLAVPTGRFAALLCSEQSLAQGVGRTAYFFCVTGLGLRLGFVNPTAQSLPNPKGEP